MKCVHFGVIVLVALAVETSDPFFSQFVSGVFISLISITLVFIACMYGWRIYVTLSEFALQVGV
jgi:hypothetical protein